MAKLEKWMVEYLRSEPGTDDYDAYLTSNPGQPPCTEEDDRTLELLIAASIEEIIMYTNPPVADCQREIAEVKALIRQQEATAEEFGRDFASELSVSSLRSRLQELEDQLAYLTDNRDHRAMAKLRERGGSLRYMAPQDRWTYTKGHDKSVAQDPADAILAGGEGDE